MKFLRLLLTLALLLSRSSDPVSALPLEAVDSLSIRTLPDDPILLSRAATDAPFLISTTQAQSTIVCPNGVKGRTGGIVLLIHGTGSSGKETWGSGPYVALLPNYEPGYDVCYVNLPSRSWQDAQVTAEYVARAIQILAPQSKTKKVSLVAHSQGNINTQWALRFWPSVRPLVSHFVSLAGDYKGTKLAKFGCFLNDLVAPGRGCQPSLLQQATDSRFVRVLQSAAGQALVKTTSLSTRFDEIVIPQTGSDASSVLPGANNLQLQSNAICGAVHPAGHVSMVIDPAAFELAYQAIRTGVIPTGASWDRGHCFNFLHGTGLNNNTFAKVADALGAGFGFLSSASAYPTTRDEPATRQYALSYV